MNTRERVILVFAVEASKANIKTQKDFDVFIDSLASSRKWIGDYCDTVQWGRLSRAAWKFFKENA